MMQKGVWLSLLSVVISGLLSFPASAQTRIANLVLTNGKVMQNVEILQEDDKRIQFRKGNVNAWLSRTEIKSIEILGEVPSWKKPTANATWLALWKPEESDVSNVQTVVEEGQKWNRISTKYFDLHFKNSADREKILRLARTQDNVYRFLHERTGRDIPYPIKAYLMPGDTQAHCDFKTTSIYLTEMGDLDYYICLYMHEVTHLFNKGRAQNWWSGEFMCSYDQGRASRHENGAWEFFKKAAERDSAKWAEVDGNMDRSSLPGAKWDNRLFKAGAIYYFIEETYGAKKLVEFWDRNCDSLAGNDVQPIFEAVLGKTIEELQDEYQWFYKLESTSHYVPKKSAAPNVQLRSIVSELASAKYQGRKAGDAVCNEAAEYIEELFHNCGLKPAGENGSYFQTFTVPYTEFLSSCFRLENGADFEVYRDYRPVCGNDGTKVNGPVIFVGYGLSELGYDDYRGINATGKIALALRGVPNETYKPDFAAKVAAAIAHNAAGLLVADTTDQAYSDLDEKFANPTPNRFPALHVSKEIGDKILAKQSVNVDTLKERISHSKKPQPFETGVRAEMSVNMAYEPEARTSNVLGLLEGGRDRKPADYFVVCAHYDGQGRYEQGRHFPGASDNASGVAALIAVAQALRREAAKLDFSILFAAWSGEEIDLRGSEYFCQNPTIPFDQIRGIINLDMIGGNPSSEILVETSTENNPLIDSVKRSARDLQIALTSQVAQFSGSDARPFAMRGAPTLFFMTRTMNHHKENDTPERINWDVLGNVAELAARSMTGQRAPAAEKPERLPAPPDSFPAFSGPRQVVAVDYSSLPAEQGVKFDGIVAGDPHCTKQFIKSKLGPPDSEMEHWLGYNAKYGLGFVMADDGDMLIELHLNRGFKGKLDSGISLSSSMEDVFRAYGKPLQDETVDDSRWRDLHRNRTLYRTGARSKIYYKEYGLIFSFNDDRVSQIAVFRKMKVPPDELQAAAANTPPTEEPALLPKNQPRENQPPWVPENHLSKYAQKLRTYWYVPLSILLILGAFLRFYVPRLYYYWRPLPEGRLLLLRDPTRGDVGNINIWYEARRLKKRRLLIGSDENADIRLPHPLVNQQHAFISARRTEGGVVTCIERIGSAEISVNDDKSLIMSLPSHATVEIGQFRFKYEMPSEYRQVQVLYKDGRLVEGVPTSWDISRSGFTLIPSKAPSWIDAKFIRFERLKGVYFVRDWDEDVRSGLLRGVKNLRQHPMTIHFADGEVMSGYSIGDYKEERPRFYFFPEDQTGSTVYVLIERSSVESVTRGASV